MFTVKDELPDLFRFINGDRVCSVDDWRRRREELRALILEIEYGPLPPLPAAVRGELIHRQHPDKRFLNAYHFQYRITVEGGTDPFWFILDLLVPLMVRQEAGKEPMDPLEPIVHRGSGKCPAWRMCPVVVSGDGCWSYVTDEVINEVLRRGYILARFNRTEIVPDNYARPYPRNVALYRVYPDVGFNALGAWAWGYHRVIDFISTLSYVDAARIAIVGHSRGGKAVLLAAATDERIALGAPNDSGSGGAGCFRWQGDGCEKIEDGLHAVQYWYSPRLKEYIGREKELPFDQHALKALVAPRALLSTEALGDTWANPAGTYQTYLAAREVYRFLNAEERIGIWYRDGGHSHGIVDWKAFLDFADLQFRGIAPAGRFDVNPFPDIPPAFSWSAPARK